MIELSSANYHEAVENSKTPVLVDVWAPWCAPCKQVDPLLDEMSVTYGGRLTIAKLNVESEPALAQALGVGGLPTLRIVAAGATVFEAIGSIDRVKLTQAVAAAVA